MAKQSQQRKGRQSRPTKATLDKQNQMKRALMLVAISLVLFLGLIRLGIFGTTVYNVLRLGFGSLTYVASFGFLFYLFGYKLYQKYEGLLSGLIIVFLGLLLAWHAYLFGQSSFAGKDVFSATWALLWSDLTGFKVLHFAGGGMLGALLYKPIAFLLTNIGAYLISTLLILLGVFLITPWDVYDIADFVKTSWAKWHAGHQVRKEKRFVKKEERRLQLEEEARLRAEEEEAARLTQASVDYETGEILDDVEIIAEQTSPSPVEIVAGGETEIFSAADQIQPISTYSDEIEFDLDTVEDEWTQQPQTDYDELETDSFDIEQEDGFNQDNEVVEVDFKPQRFQHYRLPSIDLFALDKPKNQSKEKLIVRDNIRVLEDTFKSFGIDVKVERAEIGPSVTKYEVKPAVGVRVNRISNLADDLALALAAKDVRIEAPIPGKSLVGIEVPNSEIATVSFRELWEQSKTSPDKLLEIPLGKAVNGQSRSFDLTRMPHLLVAGSTGSGKSVAVNGIISSILMKAKPDQVKFMMIDPKMVELSVYNDIPHLLIPVVTNPRKASKALQKVVDEMENRYELFSKVGVRNIEGYNAKVEDYNSKSDQKQIPLPLIVVIVDELADLMMVASKEVEDAIIRLGQKARAAGIHMILATQRPSVDVISGLIKANVPSRIAFAVASGTDSRTILGENGAEKLLGRGDMLFHPIGESAPVRLQGSFISDDDVERIVNFIKTQAEAEYDNSFDPGEVSEADSGFSGNGGADEGDPLFLEAKALVLETQKASASMLQRRLSVGFNRATRLMEELEEAGVIGPAEGTKPRKVLETP
ncbi:DNA translocase FtsK [Streptococcus caprae]|uniref:DNA translocase FtsK n=1 Tax=Streptococcus caprae TaxID=1640501 RepID=A0ABV8CVN3_9STRE